MVSACQPLLSVIIPTLNEAGYLPPLLTDLNAQQDILLEIIVADGGSIDATGSVAEASGATLVKSRRGRGVQMNAAAEVACGEFILFLHADSRIKNPTLLRHAVAALAAEARGEVPVAGHFSLRFDRTVAQHSLAYRYMEEKSALNRVNTTNGDQGLLLAAESFRQIGGFNENMSFLEDQHIAETIRSRGCWITLPGVLNTSARRFETEGFHRRRILMAMMMGLYSIGAEHFFARAPEVYRVQHETGTLVLTPFFNAVRRMLRNEWGLGGTVRNFYLLGRYVRQNSWQLFFSLDVVLRPILGAGRNPFLTFHDRVFGPCTNFRIFNILTGILCFVWFIGIVPPVVQLLEFGIKKQPPQ